jgi:tRNA dimethylallyltransferase
MAKDRHINPTELLGDRPGIPPMAEMPECEDVDPKAVLEKYLSGEVDLVCVVGPTASGKTRYAVGLAREFNRLRFGAGLPSGAAGAEILSADSRQVYRGMDIGTGKDLGEYGEIPVHLIDIADAGTRFNIYEYQAAFEKAYSDIRSRGGIPILCGGSGLYIDAATCGYTLPQIPPDEALRSSLESQDTESLKKRLLELRPDTTEGTLQSKRRVIRAIEVALYEDSHPVTRSSFLPKKAYFIGTLVSREERVERIDRRLDERLSGVSSTGGKTKSLVDEVKGLLESGIPAEDLVYYGLEYRYVTQYVLGVIEYGEMRTLLANAIHQFAKRQMTWFRGMERRGVKIHWTKV